MSIGRALAFLPCLVLLVVASSWLGPRTGSDSSRFAASAPDERASTCGADDCGCPHDTSPLDCCCKRHEEPVSASRVGGSVPAALDIDAAGAERPTASMTASSMGASITSFFCNGGKRSGGSAHSSEFPAALAVARSDATSSPRATWRAGLESAPPPELAREPATPPPRRARA